MLKRVYLTSLLLVLRLIKCKAMLLRRWHFRTLFLRCRCRLTRVSAKLLEAPLSDRRWLRVVDVLLPFPERATIRYAFDMSLWFM